MSWLARLLFLFMAWPAWAAAPPSEATLAPVADGGLTLVAEPAPAPRTAERPQRLTSSLGFLNINGFTANETLGRPPELTVTGWSNEYHSPPTLLGQAVSLRAELARGETRITSGFVSKVSVQRRPRGQPGWAYNIEVVSWLGLLRQAATCEIFEGLSTPDILRRVFARYPWAKYRFALRGRPPVRPVEVQYRETDLNFVSRILEHDGLFYFFEHDADGSTMVIADSTPEGLEALTAEPLEPASATHALVPNRYVLRDQNFELADPRVEGLAEAPSTQPVGALEFFDFPGEFRTGGTAKHYARLRLEELRAQGRVIDGVAQQPLLRPGMKVNLPDPASGDSQVVITQVDLWVNVGDDSEAPSWQMSFKARPSTVAFRPSRTTPKPMIQGVQTAVVAAASARNDPYGRVRIRFPWQRDNVSAGAGLWARVVQTPDTTQTGLRLPTVGQEVLVLFDEGDPNRPVVIGALFNATQRSSPDWPRGTVTSQDSGNTKPPPQP